MPAHRTGATVPEHEVDEQPGDGHEQSNWKAVMVAALTVTEKALEGLPIPAAKGCVSLVLSAIETADVAADNKEVLNTLQARYNDLLEFLLSISTEVPAHVQEDVKALQKKLEKLAKRWKPRSTKGGKLDHLKGLFRAHGEHDKLNKLLGEINQAINDFLLRTQVQICLSSYREIVQSRQTAIISAMPHAQHASYTSARAGAARTCLPGTRQGVLAAIENWALHPDPHQPPIFWLNGLAGIGKTTIAHTVASSLHAKRRLGGSFMFARTDDQLKDGNLVFPTFALQLSSVYPAYKTRLAEEVENYPTSATQSPKTQFWRLIHQPLSAITLSEPLILILDALDECHPNDLAEELLRALMKEIETIPFLRVFITSRPEGHIREALASGVFSSLPIHQTLVLHQDTAVQAEVEADVRLFLQTSLQEIWNRDTKQTGTVWPPTKDLETLVQQSGMLFIYAATAVRFIGGNRSLNIERQLKYLLEVKKTHVPNSKIEPYKQLDHFYLSILEVAFSGIYDAKDGFYLTRFQRVVGSIILMKKSLPMESLARFLKDYTINDIEQTLYYLHSIFVVPDEHTEAPRTYHLSFPNFITNAYRCTNKSAYIDSSKQELYLFLRCLAVMEHHFGPAPGTEQDNQRRRDTVDSADDDSIDEDAGSDQQPSTNKSGDSGSGDDFYGDISMTPEMKYSCDYWCSHLVNIDYGGLDAKNAMEELSRFILDEHYFSSWLGQRISRILFVDQIKKIKFAQDTFGMLHSLYRWVKDQNKHGLSFRWSWSIRKAIRSSAKTAYRELFPDDLARYRFGRRIRPRGVGELGGSTRSFDMASDQDNHSNDSIGSNDSAASNDSIASIDGAVWDRGIPQVLARDTTPAMDQFFNLAPFDPNLNFSFNSLTMQE